MNICAGTTLKGLTCKRKTTQIFCKNHLPKWVGDKPMECAVCYEPFDEAQLILNCGHWIHDECIIKSKKAECPICRANIRDKRILDQIRKDFVRTINVTLGTDENGDVLVNDITIHMDIDDNDGISEEEIEMILAQITEHINTIIIPNRNQGEQEEEEEEIIVHEQLI